MQSTEEAELFGKYIVGSAPSPEIIRRYKTIIYPSPKRLSKKDQAVLAFVHKHPRSLAAIDAYSAFFQPHSELRRRLFFMFAILEATPDYAEKFLPKNYGAKYWLTIAGVSLRALFRLIFGVIIMGYIGARR